jgi:hypothetical protein
MTGYQSKKKATSAKTIDEVNWVDHEPDGRRAAAQDKLAKPAQEPRLDQGPDYERGFVDGMQKQAQSSVDKAVNRMAQREWVGLTDDEIKEIVGPWGDTPIKGYTRELIDKIEAKLKENNGG